MAMHHRHSGIPTYELSGLENEDEHLAYAPLEYYSMFNFTFRRTRPQQHSRSGRATYPMFNFWTQVEKIMLLSDFLPQDC